MGGPRLVSVLTRDRSTKQRPTTYADLIDARSTGFDAMRLVLAFLVLVSHTWPLGGFGPEPSSPLAPRYLTLGGFAVAGFFAMSGMLVGRSAMRRTPAQFTRARVARILPGYAVAVIAGAFVVGWLAWLKEPATRPAFLNLDPSGPFGYVARSLLFPVELSYGVSGAFLNSTPYGVASGQSVVNGSLWTLPLEVRCYVVIGLLALVARRFAARWTLTAAWIAVGALAVSYRAAPTLTKFVFGPITNESLTMLLLVFLSGALVGVWGDRIRLIGPVPVVALVVAMIVGRHSLFLSNHLGNASLALLLPPVAMAIAPIGAWLRGVDLSYGMYLYAWPVQQLVAMYAITDSRIMFIVVSTIATAALAAGSWFIIEQPVMQRWGRR
jgi:peptidoglycan/LPS O-acetylase OafA/YrhL